MTSAEWKEIFQALTIAGGAASTIFGAIMLKWKLSNAKDLKRIDVSSEWQNQMLARIASVESELAKERRRGDLLETEAFTWKRTAAELEWELERARAERHDFSVRWQAERAELKERLQAVNDHNHRLQKQNQALGKELRELHRQISGYPIPTIPPPPPSKVPK